MTVQDATAKTIPWLRYSREVDAQLARKTNPAEVAAAYQAYLAGQATPRTVNGAPTYRDASGERYTVGYGGERTYAQSAPARTVKGLSDKQKDLVDKLLVEKVHEYTQAEVDEAKADWRKGRVMIDTLIAAARKPYQAPKVEVLVEVAPEPVRSRLDFSAIPDGNYAVREDGVVKFYRVSTSKRNGYKNVQVRASDELHMLFGRAGIAVLHRIVEAGLAESRMLFVTQLGRCCKCGRSLTDEASRADALVNGGFGPDCVGN